MEQSEILDEKSFQDKYWFNNYVHVTVANPLTVDYKFMMVIQTGIDRSTGKPREESRSFTVLAGGKERFVGSVANLYLDQMSKRISQDAGKFGDMSDYNAKAKYYDDLIVAIDDPYNDAAFVPYDDAPKDNVVAAAEKEEAFADVKRGPGRPPKPVEA